MTRRHGAAGAIRKRFGGIASRSERTLVLGSILLATSLSAAIGYILTQSFAVDIVSSLTNIPQDCWYDWGINVGRHCFSDYSMMVGAGLRPNPWEPFPMYLSWLNDEPLRIGSPAAGFLPQLLFAAPAAWLGAPQLGLTAYLVALIVAVLSPALWAARGTQGLERVVVFVALGAAAVPAWAVIDRGNSAGFLVPIALVFLIAIRREQWGVVAITVIVATLVKPHFVVLVVLLFAVRKWRLGGLTIVGVALTNVAAYLLWPRDFPGTIWQSIDNLTHNTGASSQGLADLRNVAFARPLLLIPDFLKAVETGGQIPQDFLSAPRQLIGYVVLIVIVAAVLLMRKRIPPVMIGILLVTAATLFPPVATYYYLVFALPIAAILVRDPVGPNASGIFDQLAAQSGRRPAVGLCLSLAVVLSIAQVPLPGPIGHIDIPAQLGARGVIGSVPVVGSTIFLAPIFWLIACAVIVLSYARRSASQDGCEGDEAANTPVSASPEVSGESVRAAAEREP